MGSEIKLEANRQTPCPLCNHDHYCFLIQGSQGQIDKAVCQWTDEAPEGWDRTGTAKDGRGIFTRRGAKRKRAHFPDEIALVVEQRGDIPQWQDHLLDMRGDPIALERKYNAQELVIEYFYPDPNTKQPIGKVVRRQWSDRRRVYDQGRKTKHVRPWHWASNEDGGWWSDRGKGDKTWPLYREAEAKEAILKGEVVFAVGGEQAVECYRQLGLTATTCQGGEANFKQIIDRLKDSFEVAKAEKLSPMLVIHPDNDITGENQFGNQLLEIARRCKVSAVALEPFDLWASMPAGGDIKDWLDSGIEPELALRTLAAAIHLAIDRQEDEIRSRQQRDRWNAPVSLDGELGYWCYSDDKGKYFYPKTDFDFQVERELVSADGGGLLLQVKRADDRGQRRVYLKSTDYSSAAKFKDSLKKALGGGIICRLSNNDLEALIRARLHEYRITRQGKAYRLVDRVGQQEDSAWVFKQCQFDKQGDATDEIHSLWVWNDKLYGDDCSMPSPTIAPHDPEALTSLVTTMMDAFGEDNVYPALLTLGYAAAGVHYQEIIAKEGSFPTLNLYGDPGSGKTTAAECALSLVGMVEEGMMRDVSLSAAYEKLKLSGSLLHVLDDPKRTPELDEFLKGFYNGKPRIVRGKEQGFNIQRPHSPMMVTTNHACGETSAATQSRLVRLWFQKSDKASRDAFQGLAAAQRAASGCFVDLIKLGYDAAAVHALETELLPHLPYAHARIAKSLALLLHYAERVIALAGVEVDVRSYVINTLCSAANDPDESGDSLRDFLEKLSILRSEGKVGDWNVRQICSHNTDTPKSLAIYLPGVWKVLDKEFDLAYNGKVIERLLIGAGGFKSQQRFHKNEDLSKAIERGLMSQDDLQWSRHRCLEIPTKVLQKFGEMGMGTELTDDSEMPETIDGLEESQSTSPVDRVSTALTEASELEPVNKSKMGTESQSTNKMLTDQSYVQQGLEVDSKSQSTQSTQEDIGNISSPSLPSVGDSVLIDAAANWIRQGSDPIHWKEIPKPHRQAPEVPVKVVDAQRFMELTDLSAVLAISEDDQRARVQNLETKRISVFEIKYIHVLEKNHGSQ